MQRIVAWTAVIGVLILLGFPAETFAQKRGKGKALGDYWVHKMYGSYPTEKAARAAALKYAKKNKCRLEQITLVGKIAGKKGQWEFRSLDNEEEEEPKKPSAPAGSQWSSKRPKRPGEVTVILSNGSHFTGQLIFETDELIKIKTPVAEMQWDKKKVKEILRADPGPAAKAPKKQP